MRNHKILRLQSLSFVVTAFFVLVLVAPTFQSNNWAGELKDQYELKVQCGKQAEKWYTQEYGKYGVISEKEFPGGGHTDYVNHYNLKLNKCFVQQSLMLNDGASNKNHVWVSITLFDINEDKEYGSFQENGNYKTMGCLVNGKKCQTEDEFNALIKPFMEE